METEHGLREITHRLIEIVPYKELLQTRRKRVDGLVKLVAEFEYQQACWKRGHRSVEAVSESQLVQPLGQRVDWIVVIRTEGQQTGALRDQVSDWMVELDCEHEVSRQATELMTPIQRAQSLEGDSVQGGNVVAERGKVSVLGRLHEIGRVSPAKVRTHHDGAARDVVTHVSVDSSEHVCDVQMVTGRVGA